MDLLLKGGHTLIVGGDASIDTHREEGEWKSSREEGTVASLFGFTVFSCMNDSPLIFVRVH